MAQDTEKNKQQSNQDNVGNQQDNWKQQPGNPRKDPQQGSGDYSNQRDQPDQDKKRRAS